MIKFQIFDGNNNSNFIKQLFNVVYKELENIYWAVGDLDIIPKVPDDYPGSGPHENKEIAWKFGEKIEREKVAFLERESLVEILDDTQSIRNGVFICFLNKYPYDYNFCPRVENKEVNNMQHLLAHLEIRILDGDLFFILSKDKKLISKLKTEFPDVLLD